MQTETTRRMLLGTAGLAIVAVPAFAATMIGPVGATPFRVAEARWKAARTRFNTLPYNLEDDDPAAFEREEESMHAAMDVLGAAPAATWDEFADAFAIACEDGLMPPQPALLRKLLADVRRLSGRAAA